jgi:N utilization substance protein B
MGSRREARELALQALYQLDVTGEDNVPVGAHFGGSPEALRFARELVDGVRAERERIDALIGQASEHWRLPRLSRVDLSLLRLSTWELLACPDTPASVVIDEAVEIARRFGSEDSAAFVNGVLDAVATAVGAKDREKAERPR